MTHRPTSPATDALLGAAQERTYAEALPSHDFAMRDMVRREAKRQAEVVTTPLTEEQLAALEVPHRAEVVGGTLVQRLQDNAFTPTFLDAHAHMQRLELAAEAGCGDLAMDAALTIQAGNSLERMLAHQLAASHAHAMRLTASADAWLRRADHWAEAGNLARAQLASTEAARTTNAAARMIAAYQDGVATLARMRTGGQQVVTVQHVHVGEGGQAVVAGSVAAGGRKRRRG